jgi:hypothetical protein
MIIIHLELLRGDGAVPKKEYGDNSRLGLLVFIRFHACCRDVGGEIFGIVTNLVPVQAQPKRSQEIAQPLWHAANQHVILYLGPAQ